MDAEARGREVGRAVPRTGTTAAGVAAASVAMFSWGFGPVIVKLTALDGVTISFWRLWIGLAAMALAVGLARRRLDHRALRRSLAGGVLFGVQMVFFFSAVRLTSVADVMLISALQPVLVLFVASRFGETVDVRTVGWTVLSLLGVAVVIVGSAGSPVWSLRGDLLAFASLFVWTGYWLASKRARTAGVGAVEYMAVVTSVSALLITPVALFWGRDVTAVRLQDWGWLALLALVPGAGGHLLMAWAHRYVEVTASSLLMVGSPVVSVVAAWAVLGEPLGPVQAVGGLVCLAAIAAVVRRQRAAAEPVEAGPPGP
ncbi:MAG TPA: DMT family transporter [Actinomycetota bacterium]|nr:DMT family transporter [Actinomycetota bacterium]